MKTSIKIAITGRIGSGKTTLCNIIKEIGYKVYESDLEVDKLLKTEEIKKKVKILYLNKLENLFDETGNINKKGLGDFLFSSKTELNKLEKLLYPLLEERKNKFIETNLNEKLIFFDIPLLFEKEMHKKFDKIIFLTVRKEIQKNRVMKRKGMSKTKLNNVLNKQIYDMSNFKKFISIEIDSSGSKKTLEKNFKDFLKKTLT